MASYRYVGRDPANLYPLRTIDVTDSAYVSQRERSRERRVAREAAAQWERQQSPSRNNNNNNNNHNNNRVYTTTTVTRDRVLTAADGRPIHTTPSDPQPEKVTSVRHNYHPDPVTTTYITPSIYAEERAPEVFQETYESRLVGRRDSPPRFTTQDRHIYIESSSPVRRPPSPDVEARASTLVRSIPPQLADHREPPRRCSTDPHHNHYPPKPGHRLVRYVAIDGSWSDEEIIEDRRGRPNFVHRYEDREYDDENDDADVDKGVVYHKQDRYSRPPLPVVPYPADFDPSNLPYPETIVGAQGDRLTMPRPHIPRGRSRSIDIERHRYYSEEEYEEDEVDPRRNFPARHRPGSEGVTVMLGEPRGHYRDSRGRAQRGPPREDDHYPMILSEHRMVVNPDYDKLRSQRDRYDPYPRLDDEDERGIGVYRSRSRSRSRSRPRAHRRSSSGPPRSGSSRPRGGHHHQRHGDSDHDRREEHKCRHSHRHHLMPHPLHPCGVDHKARECRKEIQKSCKGFTTEQILACAAGAAALYTAYSVDKDLKKRHDNDKSDRTEKPKSRRKSFSEMVAKAGTLLTNHNNPPEMEPRNGNRNDIKDRSRNNPYGYHENGIDDDIDTNDAADKYDGRRHHRSRSRPRSRSDSQFSLQEGDVVYGADRLSTAPGSNPGTSTRLGSESPPQSHSGKSTRSRSKSRARSTSRNQAHAVDESVENAQLLPSAAPTSDDSQPDRESRARHYDHHNSSTTDSDHVRPGVAADLQRNTQLPTNWASESSLGMTQQPPTSPPPTTSPRTPTVQFFDPTAAAVRPSSPVRASGGTSASSRVDSHARDVATGQTGRAARVKEERGSDVSTVREKGRYE